MADVTRSSHRSQSCCDHWTCLVVLGRRASAQLLGQGEDASYRISLLKEILKKYYLELAFSLPQLLRLPSLDPIILNRSTPPKPGPIKKESDPRFDGGET